MEMMGFRVLPKCNRGVRMILRNVWATLSLKFEITMATPDPCRPQIRILSWISRLLYMKIVFEYHEMPLRGPFLGSGWRVGLGGVGWGVGVEEVHFYCKLIRKLRRNVLLHFGLIVFKIHLGKNQNTIIFIVSRPR